MANPGTKEANDSEIAPWLCGFSFPSGSSKPTKDILYVTTSRIWPQILKHWTKQNNNMKKSSGVSQWPVGFETRGAGCVWHPSDRFRMQGIYGKNPAQHCKSLGGKVNQLQMLTWLTASTWSAADLTLAVRAAFPSGSYQQRNMFALQKRARWWEQLSHAATVALSLLKQECYEFISFLM